MYKFIYAFVLFTGCFLAANGQRHVRGKVTSQIDGKPLPGASIYIENTSVGTVTNDSGTFSLSIPSGVGQLVASHLGFQTQIKNITGGGSEIFLAISLNKKSTALQEVVVMAESKNGWKKWGQLFTDLFIGTSAYASHCTLLNKEALRFVFSRANNILHVYASEPLILENQSLGFSIHIDLEQFSYDFKKKYLFYEIHTLYQQLQAESISDLKRWKKNRLDVYTGSPMHFYRSLFDSSFIKQGFEVHRLDTRNFYEWERISSLYQQHTGNSSNTSKADFEKNLNSDSLKYYQSILKQGLPAETINPDTLQFYEFVSTQDSLTVLLHFTGRLLITYTGKDAPHDYLVYTGAVAAPGQPVKQSNTTSLKINSILELTDNIPVEVYKNGAVKNDDLLISGFFSWWNKMATSLPLDYKP